MIIIKKKKQEAEGLHREGRKTTNKGKRISERKERGKS